MSSPAKIFVNRYVFGAAMFLTSAAAGNLIKSCIVYVGPHAARAELKGVTRNEVLEAGHDPEPVTYIDTKYLNSKFSTYICDNAVVITGGSFSGKFSGYRRVTYLVGAGAEVRINENEAAIPPLHPSVVALPPPDGIFIATSRQNTLSQPNP